MEDEEGRFRPPFFLDAGSGWRRNNRERLHRPFFPGLLGTSCSFPNIACPFSRYKMSQRVSASGAYKIEIGICKMSVADIASREPYSWLAYSSVHAPCRIAFADGSSDDAKAVQHRRPSPRSDVPRAYDLCPIAALSRRRLAVSRLYPFADRSGAPSHWLLQGSDQRAC
jgi:hypothetical protein